MQAVRFKEILCDKNFGVFYLVAFALIVVFPELADAAPVTPGNDRSTLAGIHDKLGEATKNVLINLNTPSGFINQLANVIWRTVMFILLVWTIYQYIWGEVSWVGISLLIIYGGITYSFINGSYNGQQLYRYVIGAYHEGVVGSSDELFGLTTGGVTLDQFVSWMILMGGNININSTECTLFCIADIIAAIAGAILLLGFGLLISVSYIIRIINEVGFSLFLSLGLLLVPLSLFQFGLSLFFGWLRAVVSFTFTLWFIYIVLGFVANILAAYVGIDVSQMRPEWHATNTLVYPVNSFDDIWGPFFVTIIGLIAIISASSWGGMIGGASIPTGQGLRAAVGLKLLMR